MFHKLKYPFHGVGFDTITVFIITNLNDQQLSYSSEDNNRNQWKDVWEKVFGGLVL
jgi:hypothetical protein